MHVVAVLGEPEVPDPVLGKAQAHSAGASVALGQVTVAAMLTAPRARATETR